MHNLSLQANSLRCLCFNLYFANAMFILGNGSRIIARKLSVKNDILPSSTLSQLKDKLTLTWSTPTNRIGKGGAVFSTAPLGNNPHRRALQPDYRTASFVGPCQKTANMSDELDILWKKLNDAKDCKSLLKKHLTQELYDKYKNTQTSLGGTLADCIRSGCMNLDSGVGLYACDPEAYTVFKDLFDAVIKDYHKVSSVSHPHPTFGDTDDLGFGDLDPKNEMIKSTRVRVGRSHDGFSFPPSIKSNEQRTEMEQKTLEALKTLEGELGGKYYSLVGMSKEVQKQLIDDHFLFKDDDRFLRDAGGYSFWPGGRGIFHNKDKTFLVWINEEDHLRFISMQMGGDLACVYKRLVNAIKKLEEKLSFAKKDGYGYLTFCPTNLGTTCRASVHIAVPKLAAAGTLNDICAKYNLQPRGIHGEHTESVGGVYDISNKRRLGLSEIEAIQEMRNGIEEIIKEEKLL